MTLPEIVAENLARLMKERRYDGPTFAEAMGVTKSAVYQWLSGQGMSLANLEQAAKVLKVSVTTLVRQHKR